MYLLLAPPKSIALSEAGIIVPVCVSAASLLKKLALSIPSNVSASTFKASIAALVILASTLAFV